MGRTLLPSGIACRSRSNYTTQAITSGLPEGQGDALAVALETDGGGRVSSSGYQGDCSAIRTKPQEGTGEGPRWGAISEWP